MKNRTRYRAGIDHGGSNKRNLPVAAGIKGQHAARGSHSATRFRGDITQAWTPSCTSASLLTGIQSGDISTACHTPSGIANSSRDSNPVFDEQQPHCPIALVVAGREEVVQQKAMCTVLNAYAYASILGNPSYPIPPNMEFSKRMTGFKQNENGYKGEERSRAFLSDDFWILTRSVDADSTDVIVQERMASTSEIIARRNRGVELGYIQSKFFEGKNQVKIHRNYVDDPTSPYRKGYFAFLHCNDEQDERVHYFFTAREIQKHWYLNNQADHYCFSLTKERKYEDFRNLSRKHIKEKILEGVRDLQGSIESLIWRGFTTIHSDTRTLGDTPGNYILTRPYGCPTAIYVLDGQGMPLAPRKDVVSTPGHFEWGYGGSGPKLLAASILSHFMAGEIPTRDEINAVNDYLISRLERFNTTDHVIDASMILRALCYIPYQESERETDPSEVTKLCAESLKKYAKYLPGLPPLQ